MDISKDRSLMLTSTRLTRSTLDRILYGCWTVLLWAEGPGGVVALISCDGDCLEGGFGIEAQRDRICSLGGVGVTYKPSQALVMERIMAAKAYAVELVAHKGHAVTVVTYGKEPGDVWNVAVECEACNTVLLEYDNDEG